MLPPRFAQARRLFRRLPPRPNTARPIEPRTIEATYDYVDERGQLLFQVVRCVGKRFGQRRPDGAGGWASRLGDVRRVLYHLDELVRAERAAPVYVAEGEKDVDRLRRHAQIATCNPCGASGWPAVAGGARQVLAGRDVIVIADRDDSGVGQRHARDVEASLRGVARSVRVVVAPPPYKDVSDLFDARPGKGAASVLAELIELDEYDTRSCERPGDAKAPEPRVKGAANDDRAMAREQYVILCATQRTGSTLIFDDVRNLLGYPPTESERLYHEVFRASEAGDWPSILETLAEENRVQGVVVDKVMFHYVPYLSQAIKGTFAHGRPPVYQFKPESFDPFYDCFRDAVWVLIDRRDVFAQAVSMYFAERLDLWENRDASVTRPADLGEPIPYDRDLLMQYLLNFRVERQQWGMFFRHYGITPIRLTYEDAVADYPGYLHELLAACGLRPMAPPPPRRMHKVGGDVNERYARQLREDACAALRAGESAPLR